MCDVKPNDLAGINGCSHQFCFECIEKWAERENTCPLCKSRFTKIDRKSKKRKKGQKNTKKVKQRDQRSDLVSGAALEGLLGIHENVPYFFFSFTFLTWRHVSSLQLISQPRVHQTLHDSFYLVLEALISILP